MLSAVQTMKIVILSNIWPASIERLRERFETDVAVKTTPETLPARIADADVVVMRSGVRLDRAALESASRLRMIVRAGAGLEGIDLDTARERGIRVIAVPLSAQSVAEHALGLALALSHRIVSLHTSMAAGRWEKHAGYGRDLFGKQLGLLGFGRIGQRIGELARALGMMVSATDRSPDKGEKRFAAIRSGVRFVALDELLAESDVVVIQTPLNAETRGLIDARRLAMMKPDALLINVGRGGIVDEQALFEALRDGKLGGAALDVFEHEPPNIRGEDGIPPLFTLPQFIGTPHVAAQTHDAQRHVGETVAEIIDNFATGGDWEKSGAVIV